MAGSSSDLYYRESNSSPAYNNPRFVALIVNKAEQGMQRHLSGAEVTMISNFIRKLDNDMLLRMSPEKVIASLTASIISRLARYECEEEPDRTQEFLRGEIGISGETDYVRPTSDISRQKSASDMMREAQTNADGGARMVEVSRMFGFTKASQIQKILNPNALLRTNYILMDTRYRALDNDGTKYFQWNHINNVTRAQGSVNTIGTIRDIVAMRVYPFRIPYTAALDTSYRKVSMLMREFQAQSFVAHEGRRFHFMFDIFIDGDSIYLKPEDNNDAYYRFNQPVTQIDNISIDFGSPLEEVVFDSDRSLGFASVYWDGIQTQITTQSPHNLLTGYIIYITGFTSLNPLATPTLIAQMNQAQGHNVIVVSPTVLKLSVDSSSMQQLIQGGPGITLGANTVLGITVPLALSPGDRVRITSSAAPPFFTDYGVFIVVFYDPVAGTIFLGEDSGIVVPVNCYVFKDYRPPPLTRNDGLAQIVPAGGISLNDATVTSVGASLSTDYKVGDTIYLFRVSPVFYELAYTVTSVLSPSQMLINRVILGNEVNLTALKVTRVQDNLFQVYYGGKRIFIPMELTYIAPES
jgi:hypothetical protein